MWSTVNQVERGNHSQRRVSWTHQCAECTHTDQCVNTKQRYSSAGDGWKQSSAIRQTTSWWCSRCSVLLLIILMMDWIYIALYKGALDIEPIIHWHRVHCGGGELSVKQQQLQCGVDRIYTHIWIYGCMCIYMCTKMSEDFVLLSRFVQPGTVTLDLLWLTAESFTLMQSWKALAVDVPSYIYAWTLDSAQNVFSIQRSWMLKTHCIVHVNAVSNSLH